MYPPSNSGENWWGAVKHAKRCFKPCGLGRSPRYYARVLKEQPPAEKLHWIEALYGESLLHCCGLTHPTLWGACCLFHFQLSTARKPPILAPLQRANSYLPQPNCEPPHCSLHCSFKQLRALPITGPQILLAKLRITQTSRSVNDYKL